MPFICIELQERKAGPPTGRTLFGWGQSPQEDQYPGGQGATCDIWPQRTLATPGWPPSPSRWHQNVGKIQHKRHRGPLERKAAVAPKADTNAREAFVSERQTPTRVKYLSASTERPTTAGKSSWYAGRRSGRDSRLKGYSNDIATALTPRNLDALSPRRVRNLSN
jgi:hypothetical protein